MALDTFLPPMAEITTAHIAAMATANNEPAWLIEQRQQAWAFFARTLPPEWRRTNLSRLAPENIRPLATTQGVAIQWDETLASKGVTFMPLSTAVQQHESLVRTYLGTAINPLTHKFTAMRAALWHDGVLLYVPANVSLDVPLRVCYTLADGSHALFPYSLVILEPGAQVSFIEDYTSHNDTETALVGATTEMFLAEGSQLRFASIQQWGNNVYHLSKQVQKIGTNAHSEWVSVALGAHTQHIEAEAHLHGYQSRITWHSATLVDATRHSIIAPLLHHTGSHTESVLDFRTVVKDEGYSVFDGMVNIVKESRATTTRLEEHAIHLTPIARSDSIPSLMIDTNDVIRAGHACTSGQVDEEQLFYMQARGISKTDALRMIVMGAFEPSLNAIPTDDLRNAVIEAIEARI